MARISMEKALTSAGVGVADVLVSKYLSGYSFGPLNSSDMFRFALSLGSYLVNYMGYERDYSEAMFYSSLPLVVQSVANIVEKETAKSATSTAVRVVQVPAPVSAPSAIPP